MLLRRGRSRRRVIRGLALAPFIGASALAAQDPMDTAAIARIRDEGFDRSQVMPLASTLTDLYGPRLTGSPLDSASGAWAMRTFREWGLSRVEAHRVPWNRPSWVNDYFHVHVLSPVRFPVVGVPAAWSGGTPGMVTGAVAVAPTPESVAQSAGGFRGKIVLLGPPRPLVPGLHPTAMRWSAAQLDTMRTTRRYPESFWAFLRTEERIPTQMERTAALYTTVAREGALAILTSGAGGAGNVLVGDAIGEEHAVPQIAIVPENYGRLYRLVEQGVPVSMELNVRNTVSTGPAAPFNVTAELRGSGRPGEVVMIGAHRDSWHGGTGATDNAAGVAVVMEAMRILAATRVSLRRTIRIALWTAEEAGALGSGTYVDSVFGGSRRVARKPAHDSLAAYFNIDAGTGAIRGIFSRDSSAHTILRGWLPRLAPDSMAVTLLVWGTNVVDASDQDSFVGRGLPAFGFVQDPIDYETRTHHMYQDTFERLIPRDLRHNAVVIATIAYLAANREGVFPRPAGR